MSKYICGLLLVFVLPILAVEVGEFDLKITKYSDCKGPKRKTCTRSTTKIEEDRILSFDFYVLEDLQTVKGKVVGKLGNKELLRLQIKNVCEHIFWKPVMQILFPDTESCGIRKGRYAFRVNIEDLAHKFYGGKFIYGNWSFHSVFYSDTCNMHCETLDFSLVPPVKTTSPKN